jgi:ribosomal protein L32
MEETILSWTIADLFSQLSLLLQGLWQECGELLQGLWQGCGAIRLIDLFYLALLSLLIWTAWNVYQWWQSMSQAAALTRCSKCGHYFDHEGELCATCQYDQKQSMLKTGRDTQVRDWSR